MDPALTSHALPAWFRGRRVFVTGHTGFKGAWLTAWLKRTGAQITGYALPPQTEQDLFAAARIGDGIASITADIRDAHALERVLRDSAPEIVFHLAAQSLVRRSYAQPIETYATNVMGTAHLLVAARDVPSLRAIVVVTSDKCYENVGLERGYREEDRMGGHDPYSSSKGCAELVTDSLRRSYFAAGATAVASVRAGNVIGGGDWAEDRLVPDIVRAAVRGEPCVVRNPDAVRPWQHVLEPLRGYLAVARALVDGGQAYAEAWNFGPRLEDGVRVRDIVARMRSRWDRVQVEFAEQPAGPHEAHLLRLDCAKARARLGWQPLLTLDDALDMTTDWYRQYCANPGSAARALDEQLTTYEERMATEVTA